MMIIILLILMILVTVWVDSLLIKKTKRRYPTYTGLHKDLSALAVTSIVLLVFPALTIMLPEELKGWIAFLVGIAVASAVWGFRHPHLWEMPYVFILMVPFCITIFLPFFFIFVMAAGFCACMISCLIGSVIGGSWRLLTRHKGNTKEHDGQEGNL